MRGLWMVAPRAPRKIAGREEEEEEEEEEELQLFES